MMKRPDWQLGARAHPRKKVFEVACLHANDEATKAHILDVSRAGARVHAGAPMPTGADVVLEWSDTRLRATVAWSSGGRCGVQFTTLLTERELMRLVEPS